MARKKKSETTTVKKEKKVKTPVKGEIIYVDYKNLPGNVLGKVYKVDGVKARLVYIGEKSKFEVE